MVGRAGNRIAVLAALSAVLAAAAGLCGIGLGRSGDTATDATPDTDVPELGPAIITSAPVLAALENERSSAVAQLEGSGLLIDDPPTAPQRSLRDATDGAVLRFQRWVTDEGGSVLGAYGPALDALDRLPGLRTEIDAELAVQPADLTAAIERATAAFLRYGETIASVNDTNITAVETVDLPGGNDGIVLLATVIAQVSTAHDLEKVLTFETLAGLDEPATSDRRRPWQIGLAATSALALLSLVALVVVATRSRRPDPPAHPDLATILAVPRHQPPPDPDEGREREV